MSLVDLRRLLAVRPRDLLLVHRFLENFFFSRTLASFLACTLRRAGAFFKDKLPFVVVDLLLSAFSIVAIRVVKLGCEYLLRAVVLIISIIII